MHMISLTWVDWGCNGWAVLCGAGYNLRMILRKQRFLRLYSCSVAERGGSCFLIRISLHAIKLKCSGSTF